MIGTGGGGAECVGITGTLGLGALMSGFWAAVVDVVDVADDADVVEVTDDCDAMRSSVSLGLLVAGGGAGLSG